MCLPLQVVFFGLALLLWSAERFVEGSASTAGHFSMPPLLIGMIGFGTSTPEMVVSVLAATEGKAGLALGNAYGSNIALILGVTALVGAITVHSRVLRKELPVLTAVAGLAAYQVADGELSRLDACILLSVFGVAKGTIRNQANMSCP